jgi:hypothetical protein
MGWNTYHGSSHYSRYERRGGDVRRVHLGNGLVAQLAAALDTKRRAERRERDQAERAEEALHVAGDATLAGFVGETDTLVRRTLESAGFHRHEQGEWRRKRMITMARSEGPSAGELQRCGEIGAAAEVAWLDLAAGSEDGAKAALERRLAALKAELSGPTPTALERLLVERVALAWLVAGYSAAAVAGAPGRGLSPARLAQFERRHERAHRAFLAATKTLATVRKLAPRTAG